jgi:Flp pilus assembly protein TadB
MEGDPRDRDPELRGKLAKEGRLWAMAAICALAGAVTVASTDSVPTGVLVFLAAVAVLAPLLHRYEKRRRR